MNKNENVTWSKELTKESIDFTAAELKLSFIATIDDRGWPHLTLITYNRAITSDQIVWGQFTEGTSEKAVVHSFYPAGSTNHISISSLPLRLGSSSSTPIQRKKPRLW